MSALCSASLYAQAPAGRGAAPPPPPATETVAPAIPGVVAAGTKVAIVKDGLRSSEGPILMPDGTTLFTEPGASRVYKIDKSGAMSVFIENTDRANGLALDSKGRLIATTADSIVVLHPTKEVIAKMPSRPNDLVVDKKDGIYFTLPSDKPSAVYYIAEGRQAEKLGEAASAHGIQLSPDEKTLYSADSSGEYLIAFDMQPDGKLTNKRNFGKYQGLTAPESHADGIAVDSRGPCLRGYRDRRPGVQHEGRAAWSDSDVAAPAEPRVRRTGQEDAVSAVASRRLFSVQMLCEGIHGQGEVRKTTDSRSGASPDALGLAERQPDQLKPGPDAITGTDHSTAPIGRSDEDRVSRATFIRPRMYVLASDLESSGAERSLEPALVARRPHRKDTAGPE